MARVFLVAEDMGTPPGAIALRGATNFQTPSGWDTVYTPIFNMIERPVAPMLAFASKPTGTRTRPSSATCSRRERASPSSHSIPIGQVFFVPREPITMRPCTSEELKAIEESRQEFNRQKAAAVQKTSYGLCVQSALSPAEPGAERDKGGRTCVAPYQALSVCARALRTPSAWTAARRGW